MIFYFSGQFPSSRGDWPDKDVEFDTFIQFNQPFDRLICPIYIKDAEQVLRNIRRYKKNVGSKEGNAGKAGISRRCSRCKEQ